MGVEVGQVRVMNDGSLVRVLEILTERVPYRVRIAMVDYPNVPIERAYGTVATYPLRREVQDA